MLRRSIFNRFSTIALGAVLLLMMLGCHGNGPGTILPPQIQFRGLKNLQYDSLIPLTIWVESKDTTTFSLTITYKTGNDGVYVNTTPAAGYFNPTSLERLTLPSGGMAFLYWWHAVADLDPGQKHDGVWVKATVTLKDGTMTEAVFGPITFDFSDTLGGAIPPYVPDTVLPGTYCGAPFDVQLPVVGGQEPFEWSLLPPGAQLPYFLELTYDGHVRGTIPEDYGPVTIEFSAKVTDSNPILPRSSSGNFSFLIDCGTGPGPDECAPPPEIAFATVPTATENEPYFYQCLANAGEGDLVWSITNGTLPDNMTLTEGGLLSGTPPGGSAGFYEFEIQVCDSCPAGAQCDALVITMLVEEPVEECDPPPTITTTSLPNATEGSAYTPQTLLAANGHGDLAWSVVDGALPTGLFLSQTGILSGTPAAGTGLGDSSPYLFTVQVCDSCPIEPQCDTAALQIIVNPPAGPCADPPVITSTSPLPDAAEEAAYNFTFEADDGEGALSWVLTGQLPQGLIWNGTAGTITGAPNAGTQGDYQFDVTVRDSCDPVQSDTDTFDLTVNQGCGTPPNITTTVLPQAMEGIPYSVTVVASEGFGNLTFSKISGPDFPDGLQLEEDGWIHGTPADGTAGIFSDIEIQVADECPNGAQTDSQFYNLVVNEGCADGPQITTVGLPPAVVGTAYDFTLDVTGGEGNLTWEILPDGDALPGNFNFNVGNISGLPAAGDVGAYDIHFQVCDSCTVPQCDDAVLILNVYEPCADPPNITTTQGDVTDITVGIPYNFTFEAELGEGMLIWLLEDLGSIPNGFNFGTDGVLSGTALVDDIGEYNIGVIVRDSCMIAPQSDMETFTINVFPDGCMPAPEIDPLLPMYPALGGGAVYIPLGVSWGEGTLTWEITGSDPALPGTILIDQDGFIYGTCEVADAGTYTIDIQVCDECDDPGIQCDTAQANLQIDAASGCGSPEPDIQDASIPDATVDTPYSYTMTVVDGEGTIMWRGYNMPPGLFIDPVSGQISGAVDAGNEGVYNVLIEAQDSCEPVRQADAVVYVMTVS